MRNPWLTRLWEGGQPLGESETNKQDGNLTLHAIRKKKEGTIHENIPSQ